ncbi:cytochrome p450 [Anopheles sinensis]|uniref:Cytochrome p450 n=1 Tax=Anopheles sinensis TaxID=74873 RepID=A0A084WSQ7_ANOSI|nr:cytochrome p450 [Anopheles sinensis]
MPSILTRSIVPSWRSFLVIFPDADRSSEEEIVRENRVVAASRLLKAKREKSIPPQREAMADEAEASLSLVVHYGGER